MRSHLWDGEQSVSQYWGVNAANYQWIKDWRGLSIKAHNGLDVALPNDTPLYAPFDCTCLVSAFDEGGYGNYVCVSWRDTDGVLLVAHLRSRAVSLGQRLAKGALLGLSDNTGWSTGPHTHIGYRPPTPGRNMDNGYNGYEDPLPVLMGLYAEEGEANMGIIDELNAQNSALREEVSVRTAERDSLQHQADAFVSVNSALRDQVRDLTAEVRGLNEHLATIAAAVPPAPRVLVTIGNQSWALPPD